jgi:hypothetical protein
MHTPAAAAAWVEWAVWTCNTPLRVSQSIKASPGKSRRGLFIWGECAALSL